MREVTQERIRSSIDACLSGAVGNSNLEERVLARIRGQRRPPLKVTAAMAALLVLMVLTVTALAAGAVFGIFRVGQEQAGAMRSLTSDGDTLYLMTTKGISTWQPGQEEPAMLLSEKQLDKYGLSADGTLFFSGDTLCILQPDTKTLWAFRGGLPEKMGDYSGTLLDDPALRVMGAAGLQEWALIRAVPDGGMNAEAELFLWHLPDQTVHRVEAKNVTEICNFGKDGFLLLRSDETSGISSLSVLDAASGEIAQPLCTMPLQALQGIMTHPKTGDLYAVVNGAPALWQKGGWQPMQSYALHNTTTEYALLGDGFAAIHFGEFQYIPFAPSGTMETLRICGVMPVNDEDAGFQQMYPGIAVQRQRDPAITPGDVRQMIESGDETDLFHVAVDGELLSMFADGTLQPLPDSFLLSKDGESLLPAFRSGVQYGAKMYAVPSFAVVTLWEGSEAPADFAAMLSGGEKGFYVKHAWEETHWSVKDLAQFLLNTFLLENGTDRPDFSDPGFVNALHALQQADLPQGNAGFEQKLLTTDTALNLNGQRADSGNSDGSWVYSAGTEKTQAEKPEWVLPCPVGQNASPTVTAQMYVYVLNPNAANPEAALRFLEYAAMSRSPADQALLAPENAQPALHPGVEEHMEWIVEDQRLWDAQHGQETDEDALNARLDAVRADPESWAVEENRLTIYQKEVAPHIALRLHPLLTRGAKAEGGAYDTMLQTILRCANGEFTPEQCAEKLNQLLP